jgi:hypothetical protein
MYEPLNPEKAITISFGNKTKLHQPENEPEALCHLFLIG